MVQTSFSDDLRRYLALLLQWTWLLLLTTILAAGSAYILSKRSTPVYQASTLVLINEAPSNKSAVDLGVIQTSERLAKTYAETMTTRPVLEGVVQSFDLGLDLKTLKESIQVQPLRDTQLLKVTVEDNDPARAALVANALVAEFAEQNKEEQASRYAASKQALETQLEQLDAQIQEAVTVLGSPRSTGADLAERDRLEATLAQYRLTYTSLLQSYEQVRLAEAQSTATVVQKEPAIPPTEPIRPRVMVNTLLAAVVGLMLAAGVIFLIEALDDTLKSPDEIARQLNLPVLGLISRHETKDGEPVTAAQPRAPVSEAFRALRTNIQFSSIDRPLRSLLVTSASPQEGKTTISANLAVVLAQSGRKVVLIDSDLRRPRVHKLFNLSNRSGLTGLFLQLQLYLDGKINVDHCLQQTMVSDLVAITSGSLPPNPAELLGSEKMMNILGQIHKQTDVVVIDSPPVLAVTDAAVLAPRMDGVVLVVKPGQTKLAAAKLAADQLRRVGANLLGVVLNDVEFKRTRYDYYQYSGNYYAYGKGYGYGANDDIANGKGPKVKKGEPLKV